MDFSLTPEQEKKARKLAAIVDQGSLAIVEHLIEVEASFDEKAREMKAEFKKAVAEIKASVPDLDKVLETVKGKDGEDSTVPGPKGDRGEDGYTPIKNVDYFDGKDGKNGANGVSPDKNEIIREVVALIPPVSDGEDGKDGKDGSPDTGAQIVEKINALELEPELQIGLEHIKGWKGELDTIRASIPRGGSGGTSKRRIRSYDLSSQCNSITKAFTVPGKTTDIIGVFGTGFPVNFAPITDWTFSGRTITLGASVPPPETNQTLWCLLESLF